MIIDLAPLLRLTPGMAWVYREAFNSAESQLEPFGVFGQRRRLYHFAAQTLHETGGYLRTHENLSYRAERLMAVWPTRFKRLADAKAIEHNPEAIANIVYAGRMGNTYPGDGWRFRGRGFLMLTGRTNYVRIGKHLNVDLVTEPDLVVSSAYALSVAGAFWQLAGCNQAADAENLELVTRRINGGLHGLVDRGVWLRRVREAYGEYGHWQV